MPASGRFCSTRHGLATSKTARCTLSLTAKGHPRSPPPESRAPCICITSFSWRPTPSLKTSSARAMRRRFYEKQLFLFQKIERRKKPPPHLPYKQRSPPGRYLGYPLKLSFHGEVVMMLDQVKNLSHQMRLFGIHQACDRRAAEALSQQLHPLEFLRLVLEEELLSRKDRTAKALTTKARFRFRADLEDLDLTFHKDLTKAKIKELSELSFLHNLENLLILGKTGLGKTHLAIALGKGSARKATPLSSCRLTFSSKKSRLPRPRAAISTTFAASSNRALIMRWPIEGSGAHDGTKPERIGLISLRLSLRRITGTSCEGAML